MYKVGNVASFGVAGLMVDVVVEGAVLSQLLHEFLVGPVILMGTFAMSQVPQKPQTYLVVLRPFSVAFYSQVRAGMSVSRIRVCCAVVLASPSAQT